jgi:disulfide bond formation protein DsbB
MTPLVQSATNFASYLTVIADIIGAFLLIILITPLKNRGRGKKIADFFGNNAVLLSFLVALASVLGSLFFSEIAQFQPCLLCWWQRIFLYPQAVILLVALIAKKDDVRKYCLSLSVIGGLISVYHTYLQFGGTALGNCGINGISCEHVYFTEYGYVTIPTMALTAFALIIIFLCFKKKR